VRLAALAGSGFKSMNPALLEVTFTESSLTVTAWAKEGLIPQRTAQKAIDAYLQDLG
jgi:hypothetical protein